MTRTRIEWIIEGTSDADPLRATWREYGFRGKPGDVWRVPGWFAPYHLRLDWLMWFLPLGSSGAGRGLEDWFRMLLVRLLQADPPTLRLLGSDPFAGERPRWVRVVSYRYRFAAPGSGAVWVRDRRRVVQDPVSLGDAD